MSELYARTVALEQDLMRRIACLEGILLPVVMDNVCEWEDARNDLMDAYLVVQRFLMQNVSAEMLAFERDAMDRLLDAWRRAKEAIKEHR